MGPGFGPRAGQRFCPVTPSKKSRANDATKSVGRSLLYVVGGASVLGKFPGSRVKDQIQWGGGKGGENTVDVWPGIEGPEFLSLCVVCRTTGNGSLSQGEGQISALSLISYDFEVKPQRSLGRLAPAIWWFRENPGNCFGGFAGC